MFAPIVLLLVVVLYRVALPMAAQGGELGWMQNFSPIAAIALCGAVYLPKRAALALPLLMLLLSDVLLNVFVYQVPLLTLEILPRYPALLLIGGLGFLLRDKVRLPGLLGASVAGSLAFYVVTNTGSWLGQPAYAKTFAGWAQALTSGLPGYPSTFSFYTHTLASDVAFTLLFAGCVALSRPAATAAEPAIAAAR